MQRAIGSAQDDGCAADGPPGLSRTRHIPRQQRQVVHRQHTQQSASVVRFIWPRLHALDGRLHSLFHRVLYPYLALSRCRARRTSHSSRGRGGPLTPPISDAGNTSPSRRQHLPRNPTMSLQQGTPSEHTHPASAASSTPPFSIPRANVLCAL
jgi:hypothetical protein